MQRSYAEVPRLVVLGDGAAWIWRMASEELPESIQVVGLWYAKEYRWEVEWAVLAWTRQYGKSRRTRCDELEEGRLEVVLRVLGLEGATCAEATQYAD